MSYQTIIQQLKDKNPECLEALYVTYGQQLYAYCIQRWSMQEDTAWEVVYKTLAAIVTKAGQYDFQSQAHFHNFLYKVLLNNIKQEYRKEMAAKVELEFVDMDNDEETPFGIQSILNKIAFTNYYQQEEQSENGILQSLTEALSKLDPLDKDLLLLKAQHYTYDEIASMLGIENNQLKVKHHRAKQKLINLLNNILHHEQA